MAGTHSRTVGSTNGQNENAPLPYRAKVITLTVTAIPVSTSRNVTWARNSPPR